jgi:hypothetical protein
MDESSPPPVTTPPPQATAFPHQAAKASWASAALVFVLVAFGRRTGATVVIELIALALMLVGLALGVISLFGIRKYGTKHILAPALVGILINGLLLSIFITNFLAAMAKAQRHASAWTMPAVTVSSESPIGSNEFRRVA